MISLLAFMSVTACDPDPDADGLSSAEEQALGTDPNVADSDGDGLTDDAEANTYGSDPAIADSDGDGLDDGEEVFYGLDPLNPDSRGYSNGYPLMPNTQKSALMRRPIPLKMEVGQPIAPAIVIDESGEAVELYDLLGSGKPLLLVIGDRPTCLSAGWWADRTNDPETGAPNEASRVMIESGRANFALVVDWINSGGVNPPEPPTFNSLQEDCSEVDLWCFGDPFWTLYTQSGPPASGAWIVLDKDATIRSLVFDENTGFEPDLTPIDSVLSALVDP
jgi:hypothetical protein